MVDVSVASGDDAGIPVLDGAAGSLAVCGDSFEVGEGSPGVGTAVLDTGRVAGLGVAGLMLVLAEDLSAVTSRSFSTGREIPDPTATRPSRTFRSTVPFSTPSSVATCSST